MAAAGGRVSAGAGASLIGQHAHDRNADATCFVGNLEPQCTEELVWELFVQTGKVVNVYMPKDRVTGLHQGFGFVEYRTEEDAEYVRALACHDDAPARPLGLNDELLTRASEGRAPARLREESTAHYNG